MSSCISGLGTGTRRGPSPSPDGAVPTGPGAIGGGDGLHRTTAAGVWTPAGDRSRVSRGRGSGRSRSREAGRSKRESTENLKARSSKLAQGIFAFEETQPGRQTWTCQTNRHELEKILEVLFQGTLQVPPVLLWFVTWIHSSDTFGVTSSLLQEDLLASLGAPTCFRATLEDRRGRTLRRAPRSPRVAAPVLEREATTKRTAAARR